VSSRRPPRDRRPKNEQPAPQLPLDQAAPDQAAPDQAPDAQAAAEAIAGPVAGSQPGRGRPRREREGFRPRGFEDVPELSDEEVERRVGVRGGAPPRAPVERPVRTARPPRREERTVARDSLLLIGLVVVGLVTVRLLLPDGPLTAVSSSSPGTSLTAISSPGASGPGPSRTPSLITLPPGLTPSPGTVVTDGPPTEPPAPTPTLRPGQTPAPTAKPTPKPTAKPTAGPTTAEILIKFAVVKDSGGSSAADPSDWLIVIKGDAAPYASDNNFTATTSGTTVIIPAGMGYRIVDNNARPDFAAFPVDSDCYKVNGGGGLAPGAKVTCVITRDDKPRIKVVTTVNGGGPSSAGDVNVTVSGGEATPASFPGESAGRDVVVGFGLTYTISMSNLADYDKSAGVGACGPQALPLDSPPQQCEFTYTYNPPATPEPTALVVPFLPLLRPRRWRTTPTG
jgi:hypothetical protein